MNFLDHVLNTPSPEYWTSSTLLYSTVWYCNMLKTDYCTSMYSTVISFGSRTCFKMHDRTVRSKECVQDIAQKTGYIHVTSFGSRTCFGLRA